MSNLTSNLILSLVDRVTAPARGINATVAKLNASIASNTRQVQAMQGQFLGTAAAGYALVRGLSAPIGAAIEWQSSLADIAKVTDFSGEGLSAYGRELRQLAANEIPMAVTELAALSESAAAAGIAQEDLLDFTRMTAMAATAWGVTGAQAGEDLAKLQSALKLTIGETQVYADAINHLSDNTASTAPDLVAFGKVVASQGEFFGFSKEQTLAFGSAMISTGAGVDVAATSFRNMGQRLTLGTRATAKQQAAFKTLGLNAGKVSKAMQEDAVGTTIAVIEALGKLPAHMQAGVMSEIFGNEARALAPLLSNVDTLRDTLGLVSDETAYAGSVSREFAQRSATTANAMVLFRNKAHDLGITVGSVLLPAMNETMATIGPLIQRITEFAEAHPALIRNAVLATTAIVGFRVALVGLKLLGLLSIGSGLRVVAGGMRAISMAAGGVASVANVVGLQTALAGMAGIKVGPLSKIGLALRTIVMAVPGVAALGGILAAIGTGLAAISLPVWAGFAAVAVAVGGAGLLIYKYWDRLTSVFSGIATRIGEELAPALEVARPLFVWLGGVGKVIGDGFGGAMTALQEFGAWVGSFFQQEVLTDEQKAAFGQAGYDVADSMISSIKEKIGELIDWFKGLPGMIVEAIGSIDIGSIIQWPTPPDWLSNLWGGAPAQAMPGPVDLPARAMGGSVSRGMTALVGELGPEIVTFGRAGYVHPNGVIPRPPGMPSRGGGGQQGIAGGTAFHMHGDVILQNPVNASPETIARMMGDVIGRRMQTSFSDGAV